MIDICFETGLMGDPVADQYADRASFGHLFCTWYADNCADTCWVIDLEGRAEGYLLGCADVRTMRQDAHMSEFVRRHVLARGLLVRPGTAHWFARAIADMRSDRRALRNPADLERYPAELHIDLMPSMRGLGLGRALTARLFEELADRGVPGVHLRTWGENTDAIAFFRSIGFHSCGQRVPSGGFRTLGITGSNQTAAPLDAGRRSTVRTFVRPLP